MSLKSQSLCLSARAARSVRSGERVFKDLNVAPGPSARHLRFQRHRQSPLCSVRSSEGVFFRLSLSRGAAGEAVAAQNTKRRTRVPFTVFLPCRHSSGTRTAASATSAPGFCEFVPWKCRKHSRVGRPTPKTKRPHSRLRMRPLNLILAVTYVPASFPAQYHRPGKA